MHQPHGSPADDEVLILLCTAPTTQVGAVLARIAVEARLAACVNILDGVRSVYVWEGAVCDEPEVQLLFKTTRARIEALCELVREAHPYEVPELLVLPADNAASSPAYLRFVRDAVG
ncbi:MAG: divalent-cation tolerance protein CutA [Myxococcales bacterium]|nr:divalent-cation tolerance protein CutA [Myxococcales bacterium]MCB9627884.1 divalent-cation tolerance protein CutA [Sandaracinaceae bacterium]